MAIAERLALYRKLEVEERKRPLLVYVTNERPGVPSRIAGDVLPEIMDQLERLPGNTKELDFLVVSNGGDPTVAFRIMTLLRERVDQITVLIPQAAYSAATLLALGADKIIMHPNGNLGPVDPQIQIRTNEGSTEFSSVDVTAFLRFVKEEVGLTDQKHLGTVFQTLCNQIGSVPLGYSTRALQLSASLGQKLLRMHLKGPDAEQRASTIADSMCKDFFDHGYAVGRKEAKQLGLEVENASQTVEKLIWDMLRS